MCESVSDTPGPLLLPRHILFPDQFVFSSHVILLSCPCTPESGLKSRAIPEVGFKLHYSYTDEQIATLCPTLSVSGLSCEVWFMFQDWVLAPPQKLCQ